MSSEKVWRPYTVTMIHRVFDRDASLTFTAASAKEARRRAPVQMAQPVMWLPVRAALAKEQA